MFKVHRFTSTGNWSVTDENHDCMHADGSVYHRCGEYWPTKEQAQAVLDKHQPPHVWEHGDVFKRESGAVLIYLVVDAGPVAYCVRPDYHPHPDYHPAVAVPNLKVCLSDATFLFNVEGKL